MNDPKRRKPAGSSWIDDDLSDSGISPSGRPVYAPAGKPWKPPADVAEQDHAVLIRMEVPGIDENDLSILQEGRHVIVQGRRARPPEESGSRFHLMEIQYGPFARAFEFPEYLDLAGVSAAYQNGFLLLTVPKSKKAPASRNYIKIAITQEGSVFKGNK